MGDVPDCQHDVDARGLLCPEPVMLLHMRVRRMHAGEVVRLVATDPSTDRDIPKFCEHLGHTLLRHEVAGGEHVFWVRRKD